MRKRALLEKGENISHQHCSEEHRHGQTPAQCISHRPDVNRRGAAQDRYDRERHLDAHEGDRQRQGAHSHLVEDAHCAGIPMNCDVSRAIFFGKMGWNIVAAHCQPSRACRRGMLPRARRPCFSLFSPRSHARQAEISLDERRAQGAASGGDPVSKLNLCLPSEFSTVASEPWLRLHVRRRVTCRPLRTHARKTAGATSATTTAGVLSSSKGELKCKLLLSWKCGLSAPLSVATLSIMAAAHFGYPLTIFAQFSSL